MSKPWHLPPGIHGHRHNWPRGTHTLRRNQAKWQNQRGSIFRHMPVFSHISTLKKVALLGILLFAFWTAYKVWFTSDTSEQEQIASGFVATASAPSSPSTLVVTDESKYPADQVQPAANSAPPPLDNYKLITRKPDALSDLEWSALKNASGHGVNSEHELARMADYAVFQKKFMQWQSPDMSASPSQREHLGRELLDEIPNKVAQGVLATQQAEQIQEAVLTELTSEPTRRAQLLDIERRRLPAQPYAAPAFPR